MGGERRFEVLGPVRAWRGDAEVEIGSPRQRAVLGVLLLRGGAPATPDQLISAVWGETPPRAAVGMVRSYVSRLRRALGDGLIASVGGGYALASGTVDHTEFERRIGAAREARHAGDAGAEAAELRSALALWRGTPLTGVRGEYAEYERARLERIRTAAVEDLAAADLALGRATESAAALAPVVAEHPLRERPHELLMLALHRSGRRTEALALYQDLRRRLADELGLDPGPELSDLHRRILAADPTLLPVAETPPVPAQLPPALPDFTGRADVFGDIVDALSPPGATVPVVGVVGLAGVGKTALAVQVAHSVAARFPDGQLFVDLRAPGDPLATLLHGLGVAVPDGAGERVALWRTLTTGRRLLVVLDDVRDAGQVRTLLPSSGGAVLVTARRRLFDLGRGHWLKLDGLREDESLALLEGLVGATRIRAEPAAARRLARRSAGLPQVLRALGTRLASRPGWSLASAIERLHPPRPDETVRRPECTAIEEPYESVLRELSPAQARALRLLAVPDTEDISVAVAANVLDVPAVEAENLLESLADAHLLEPDAGETYRYLGPVQAFARGLARRVDGPAEVRTALTRHAAATAVAELSPA